MSEFDTETGEIIPTQTSYRRSAEINELFAALCKAQGEFENAEKAGKGNFGKYATLAAALEATKKGRAANGLALIQLPTNGTNHAVALTTILGHSSGQWIESTFEIAPTKWDAQGAGSVITYLRRYCAMAALGLAPENDDDGQAAVQPPDRSVRSAPAPQRNGPVAHNTPTVRQVNPERERAKAAAEKIRTEIATAHNEKYLMTHGLRDAEGKIDEALKALITGQGRGGQITWENLLQAENEALIRLKQEEQENDLLAPEETEDDLLPA